MKKIIISGLILGIVDVVILSALRVGGYIDMQIFTDTLVKTLGVIAIFIIGSILIKFVLSSISK